MEILQWAYIGRSNDIAVLYGKMWFVYATGAEAEEARQQLLWEGVEQGEDMPRSQVKKKFFSRVRNGRD